jgi:hypothetical protein
MQHLIDAVKLDHVELPANNDGRVSCRLRPHRRGGRHLHETAERQGRARWLIPVVEVEVARPGPKQFIDPASGVENRAGHDLNSPMRVGAGSEAQHGPDRLLVQRSHEPPFNLQRRELHGIANDRLVAQPATVGVQRTKPRIHRLRGASRDPAMRRRTWSGGGESARAWTDQPRAFLDREAVSA